MVTEWYWDNQSNKSGITTIYLLFSFHCWWVQFWMWQNAVFGSVLTGKDWGVSVQREITVVTFPSCQVMVNSVDLRSFSWVIHALLEWFHFEFVKEFHKNIKFHNMIFIFISPTIKENLITDVFNENFILFINPWVDPF